MKEEAERQPQCTHILQFQEHAAASYIVTLWLTFINFNSGFKQFIGNSPSSPIVPESQCHHRGGLGNCLSLSCLMPPPNKNDFE